MNHEPAGQYETAVCLLRQLQGDYRVARKELQDVSSHFSNREALAAKRLQIALAEMDKINANRYGCTELCLLQERQGLALTPGSATSHQTINEYQPTLQVYCLGEFQVCVGWKKIEQWRSIKAKSLLKYLVSQEIRPISKDALMESLWPGCEPSLARNNLKAAVHALRQTLYLANGNAGNFAWVLFKDGNYRINSEVDLWMDVEQFYYHWSAGRQSEKEGKLSEAIREYGTAVSLYRGDYLKDDLYEAWTYLQREALVDTYVTILAKLADHAMQIADYEGCIVYCQKILAKDECREDAYRRLMCCHSRLGQRNRAIHWYRTCEKIIRRELDVYPDHSTGELHQKLLNDEYI